jgi:probable rRNA maturation factor
MSARSRKRRRESAAAAADSRVPVPFRRRPPAGVAVEFWTDGPGRGLRRRVTAAIRRTLARHDRAPAAIHVAVVGDIFIAELHQRYLGIPGPTDVLSFDLSDDGGLFLEGQIVVSADTARREARARRIPFEQELLRYAIHGTLHLLGYDDDTPGRARTMHRVEDELLGLARQRPSRGGGS